MKVDAEELIGTVAADLLIAGIVPELIPRREQRCFVACPVTSGKETFKAIFYADDDDPVLRCLLHIDPPVEADRLANVTREMLSANLELAGGAFIVNAAGSMRFYTTALVTESDPLPVPAMLRTCAQALDVWLAPLRLAAVL